VPDDRFLALAERIRHGRNDLDPSVLYGDPLTILAGHPRATAFGLAGEHAPTAIRVIVGLDEHAPAPPPG
jgi:hypothetical protein